MIQVRDIIQDCDIIKYVVLYILHYFEPLFHYLVSFLSLFIIKIGMIVFPSFVLNLFKII